MSRNRPHAPAVRGLIAVAMMIGFVAGTGCGRRDDHAIVTGAVNVDGVPLDQGTLEFRTPNGAGIVALATIKDGRFEVPSTARLQPGSYRVVIGSLQKSGKQIPASSPVPPGTMVDEFLETIPSRYNERSELTRDVVAGPNTLEFNLVK